MPSKLEDKDTRFHEVHLAWLICSTVEAWCAVIVLSSVLLIMVWCPPDSYSRMDRSLCQTSARLTQVSHITDHDLGPLLSFFRHVPPESASYLSPCWLSWKYELWFRPRTFHKFRIDRLAFPRVALASAVPSAALWLLVYHHMTVIE